MNGNISQEILVFDKKKSVDLIVIGSHIRAAGAHDPEQVPHARHDDDLNILTLAADHLSYEQAQQLVEVFLTTPHQPADRNQRRLTKIAALENTL